jgi:hypothetical protein
MHKFPTHISNKLKSRLEEKNPEIFLYIDNPYIEELINNLIDVFAEELVEIKNEYIAKKDLRRF